MFPSLAEVSKVYYRDVFGRFLYRAMTREIEVELAAALEQISLTLFEDRDQPRFAIQTDPVGDRIVLRPMNLVAAWLLESYSASAMLSRLLEPKDLLAHYDEVEILAHIRLGLDGDEYWSRLAFDLIPMLTKASRVEAVDLLKGRMEDRAWSQEFRHDVSRFLKRWEKERELDES